MIARRLLASGGAGTFPVAQLEASELLAAPDGGWVWFVSRKAIRNDDETLVGYITGGGDVKASRILNADLSTVETTTIYDNFLVDDHEPPSFVVRGDGKVMAAFAYHLGPMYVGIGDTAGVLPAQADITNITSSVGTIDEGTYGFTYATILYLDDEDRYYIFFRYHNASLVPHFGYTYSDDDGATWAAMTLVANVTYHHVVKNGTGRLDFVLSDHPGFGEGDNPANKTSIYHMYYEGGDWFESDGTQIMASMPFALTDMTKVYDGSTTKAWLYDIALAGTDPVIAYVTFPGNDGSSHFYRRAHWTGSAWVNHDVIDGGGTFVTDLGVDAGQVYYSGGVCLDHSDPDVVYASVEVGSGRWDIYRMVTTDDGATWTSTALTDSGKNVRPVSVIDHSDALQVVWMRGTYESYFDYSTGTWGAGT